MNQKLLKYLLDIQSVIGELESIMDRVDHNYETFQKDFMAIRAVERDLEIIGEAINKINRLDPTIHIDHSRDIIGLRNLISHAYDSIDVRILWSVLKKDLPLLKEQVESIRSDS